MEERSLRHPTELREGHLPSDHVSRVGRPGTLEKYDACEAQIRQDQLVMEGIALEGGRKPLQLHVKCFDIWDEERRDRNNLVPRDLSSSE